MDGDPSRRHAERRLQVAGAADARNVQPLQKRFVARPVESRDVDDSAVDRHHGQREHRRERKGAISHQRSVDVRYQGQGYELNVPYTRNLIRDFRREHQRRYGYNYPTREVELVTLRLRATVKSPQAGLAKGSSTGHVGTGALARPGRARPGKVSLDRAPVFFSEKRLAATIFSRDSMPIGRKYSGPAIITEYSATTAVPPDMRFKSERSGNLVIEIAASSGK